MLTNANHILSESDQKQIVEIGRRYRFSPEAIAVLHRALISGGYKMAQFNHPELGGMGQWSGGMIMIGDFANTDLKQRVQAACIDLVNEPGMKAAGEQTKALSHHDAGAERLTVENANDGSSNTEKKEPAQTGNWWPPSFGNASSTGSQNDHEYAYFPTVKRLAIRRGTKVTIFDTSGHKIFGASQGQSVSSSLSFESEQGNVDTAKLPVVETYTCEH